MNAVGSFQTSETMHPTTEYQITEDLAPQKQLYENPT